MAYFFEIGQRVELTEKKLCGKIAYIGPVDPHPGNYYGVILDQPKGKNNGTYKGKLYFSCEENHGLFVRRNQIVSLDNIEPKEDTGSATASMVSSQTITSTKEDTPVEESEPALVDNASYLAKIVDLEEKLQTLKIKRAEDKLKLKEMEKLKIQNQQLNEFKRQILESQSELQKQLSQAKKEAEDAIQEKLRHAEEMKDLSETAEIATLDKEMAEEKYEQLAKEFESLKEKLEETTVDLELLKSEVELKGGEGITSAYELKQLQQQNARYNEAIMKLRDLSAADKVEIQKLVKQLDEARKEVLKLSEIKTKYESQVQVLEENICELKEQIDDALGSQEMVEILTERNLELEDQVKILQGDMDHFEEETQVNEQLLQAARESELEIREELDLSRSKLNTLMKKLEDSREVMANYESTIQKFRDLVKNLRDENEDLRQQYNVTKDRKNEQQVENIEFKMRFAETKAFARTVELGLRRLEVTQYRKQIELLSKFLPQSFFAPGGDHDAIQVILLVCRLTEKSNIIERQIQEKFAFIELDSFTTLDSESIIRNTNESLRQQEFVRKLSFLLTSTRTILSLYTDAFQMCSIDLYLKIASLFSELITQEKVIDYIIELLKKDQLDETVSLEGLEKVLNYFTSLYNLYLADNKVNDCRELLSYFVSIMKAGVDMLFFDMLIVRKCISEEAEGKERIDMVTTYLGDIQEFCKKIGRRLTSENSRLDLSPILENEVRDCLVQMNKAVSALSTIQHSILETACLRTSEDVFLFTNLNEIDSMITQTGGFKFLEVSLNAIMNVCSQISTGLQQGDFEGEVQRVEDDKNKDKLSPLEIRAKYVTDQSDKLSEYKTKLDTKENEINELKKALKLKISVTSEMQIRKDIAEKKLQSANKSADERVAKLQTELDEIREMMKKKEKEYEDTLNHFQADIEILEIERNELKEKVKTLSKRTMFEGLSKSTSSSTTGQRIDISPSSSLGPLESSYMQQLEAVRHALRIIKEENMRLKCRLEERRLKIDNMKFSRKLEKTKPFWFYKLKDKELLSFLDDEIPMTVDLDEMRTVAIKQQNLINEIEKFKNQLRLRLINQKMFNTARPFKDQLIEDKIEKRKLVATYEELCEKVNKFYINQKSLQLF